MIIPTLVFQLEEQSQVQRTALDCIVSLATENPLIFRELVANLSPTLKQTLTNATRAQQQQQQPPSAAQHHQPRHTEKESIQLRSFVAK